jgi:hypothetical protein
MALAFETTYGTPPVGCFTKVPLPHNAPADGQHVIEATPVDGIRPTISKALDKTWQRIQVHRHS